YSLAGILMSGPSSSTSSPSPPTAASSTGCGPVPRRSASSQTSWASANQRRRSSGMSCARPAWSAPTCRPSSDATSYAPSRSRRTTPGWRRTAGCGRSTSTRSNATSTATRRTDMRDDEMLARGGRWVVRLERHLAHPVDAVWRAVTEPAQLAQWFPTTVELDLVVGGAVRFGLPADGPGGRVLELDPPRLLAFSWQDDVLRFELEPD